VRAMMVVIARIFIVVVVYAPMVPQGARAILVLIEGMDSTAATTTRALLPMAQ